jgi:hypothetical protein
MISQNGSIIALGLRPPLIFKWPGPTLIIHYSFQLDIHPNIIKSLKIKKRIKKSPCSPKKSAYHGPVRATRASSH